MKMTTPAKILLWVVGGAAFALAWYGAELLPPGVDRIGGLIVGGIVILGVLWFVIASAVAAGVEKGIHDVPSKSNIVRNEIAAAIAEAKEDEE